jgi:hypothetical protein
MSADRKRYGPPTDAQQGIGSGGMGTDPTSLSIAAQVLAPPRRRPSAA